MTESRCPACTCIGFHTGDCTLDEMTLRDRIVAVQQAHIFCITECSCGYMFPWEKSTEWRERAEWEWAGHVADAILAIPDIAVVELPEPDYEDPTGHGWNGDPAGGVYAHGGKVYDEESSHTPAQARAVAANWLAAADYAERDQ